MENVAILTTSQNQREKTISVLKSCVVQIDKMKNEMNFSFTIFLLDEQSTDGTVDAVTELFPLVKIVQSDSKEERLRGLKRLWEFAAQDNPDFYLIIDARISLKEDAIACMMENSRFLKHKALIVGTISSKNGDTYLYGGLNKHGKIVVPDDVLPLPCYTFDGKLLLIPKSVYKTIGSINPDFKYRFADYDYGWRAKKQRIDVVVAPRVLGNDEMEDSTPIWRNASYPLSRRYKAMNTPEGCPPKDKFIYDLHRCGLLGAIANDISIWLKVLFPKRKTNN